MAEYTPNYTCVYIYDESGAIIGVKYISTSAGSSWQTYFFEKNMQGDVIAVYSDTGTKLVSYRYDAWGNVTTTYHNGGASTLAANNPIRYRSYYFDTTLQMYYLQSRYYDAKICRFINADSYVSTGQGLTEYNMFAYCGNNPVMRVDPAGNSWYDWVNTIAGFLNPISTLTAIAALTVAVAQGRWEDIEYDFNNGYFDPFNQDENDALDARVLGFYKGSSVIRQGIDSWGACSILGTIWIGSSLKSEGFNSDDLNHEFGHSVQERLLGLAYITTIAIPSLSYNIYDRIVDAGESAYYSTPWERTADFLGGVTRTDYKPNSMGWAITENILGPIVIPFYFIFGY